MYVESVGFCGFFFLLFSLPLELRESRRNVIQLCLIPGGELRVVVGTKMVIFFSPLLNIVYGFITVYL